LHAPTANFNAYPIYDTMKDQRFRAETRGNTFDIALRDGQLWIDDAEVAYSFEPISEAHFLLRVGGKSWPVTIEAGVRGAVSVTIAGRRTEVHVKGEKELLLERYGVDEADADAEREIRAPMPGLVLAVNVEPGQSVRAGEGMVVLEAMKMENELRAAGAGVVSRVHVAPGDAVGKSALLIELAP